MIRVYKRMGPSWGVSAGLGQITFWGFALFLGALPFIILAYVLYLTLYAFALLLALALMMYGVAYKYFTGKDARVKVPGSGTGTHPLELWMIKKGWIQI